MGSEEEVWADARTAAAIVLLILWVLAGAALSAEAFWLAEQSPVTAAAICAGAAGSAIFLVLAVVPESNRWSLRRGDSKGLVLGVALAAGSLGFGVAYLNEKGSDELNYPPGIDLSVRHGRYAESERYGTDQVERDGSSEYTITLSAEIHDCDSPVELTVAFYPRRRAGLSGRFTWALGRFYGSVSKGEVGFVHYGGVEAIVGGPDDGGQAFYGKEDAHLAQPRYSRDARSGAKVAGGDPVTRDRPFVATFRGDWLERRSSRSCFMQLPQLSGRLKVRGPEGRRKVTVARFVRTVHTQGRARVVTNESDPAPETSSTGQSAWICREKPPAICPTVTVVAEDEDASFRLNLTLLVLGGLISLGFTIVIQTALGKMGVDVASGEDDTSSVKSRSEAALDDEEGSSD